MTTGLRPIAYRTTPEIHRYNAARHAKRRAWLRMGVVLTTRELSAIEASISSGKAKFVCDCPGPRQAYRVKVRGVERIAIFDVRLWCIVTFLNSEGMILGRRPA